MEDDLEDILDYEEEEQEKREEKKENEKEPPIPVAVPEPVSVRVSCGSTLQQKRPRDVSSAQEKGLPTGAKRMRGAGGSHKPPFSPIKLVPVRPPEVNKAAQKSLNILLCGLPPSVAKVGKIKQQMSRFGEVASVEVVGGECKAVVKYLTISGANRAFTASTAIFQNSAIEVYRIPDYSTGGREAAEKQKVRAPNRATSQRAVKGSSDSDSVSNKANRSWSRPGTVKKQTLLTAQDQKEISKVRLKEKLAYKELAVAKKKLALVGKELVVQKQKLNELSSAKKQVSSQQKQQVLSHITSLMMQLKNAESAVTKANKSVQAATKNMNAWRQKIEGTSTGTGTQQAAGSSKPTTVAPPTMAQLSNLQEQLLKLRKSQT